MATRIAPSVPTPATGIRKSGLPQTPRSARVADDVSRRGDRLAVAPRAGRRDHAAMSNDHAEPSPDEVADQIMEDAEGGIESSTLDAPDDASDSAEPD
jgi:hypothetical protein